MCTFNLSDSMLSLPSNFEIYDNKINNEDFLKSCFKEFLDSGDENNKNESGNIFFFIIPKIYYNFRD